MQPDWYLGFADGLLRIIPAWETHAWGHTVSWNIILPVLVTPVALWVLLLLVPFVEHRFSKDDREHHLLQRPRDVPNRTAFVVALMTFYALSWTAGGNDIIAIKLHLSINQITYALRVLVLVGPVIAFLITKRWSPSLQLRGREVREHGRETGVIVRSPQGGYTEKHAPAADPVRELRAKEGV